MGLSDVGDPHSSILLLHVPAAITLKSPTSVDIKFCRNDNVQ
jgi:hypothetical protein